MKPRSDLVAGLPPPPPISMTRKLAVILASFAGLAIIGWIDYVTGYELGIFVLYSVPVGMTAWYAGRWPALLTALGASVTWWLADRLNGVNFSSRFYIYWNLAIHFLAFVINAVTIAKIKRQLDDRHALEAELIRVKGLLDERSESGVPTGENASVSDVSSTPA